jgi:Na+/H+ antiporter NhaB
VKIVRLFIFAYILAVLGSNVFLAVQYSFWVACVTVYCSTMLVVAVIAFVGGSRPSWKSNSKVVNNQPDEIIADGQAVSDNLKAA